MKINTRNLPYEEVLKLPRLEHKLPRKPSKLLATVVRIGSMPSLLKTKFSYTTERMELVGDQPCLILMNHSSFMDLEIASHIFFPQALRHRHHLRWLCGPADAVAYAPAGLHSHPEICQ